MSTNQEFNQVTRTGLYWPGKRTVVECIALPFQVVETVNVSRATREGAPLLAGLTGEEDDGWRNKLIWGENKYIMASLLDQGFAGKINLIYIDPPFATGADFSINMRVGDLEWTKEASVIEEKAYRDTWGKGLDSYLQMMYDRLVLIRELLAEDGSIYVHLDWHVGHYVKILLDEIFGKDNFRNMIVWHYGGRGAKAISGQFPRNYDVLLTYTRSLSGMISKVYGEFRIPVLDAAKYGFKKDEKGRWFKTAPRGDYTNESIAELEKEERIYRTRDGNIRIKYFLEEKGGFVIEKKLVGDVWNDISDMMHTPKHERLDYETQKPEALLERIIKASSREGDLVADFFCVRKGTRVLTPLNPPVNGGTSPSPLTGRVGVGSPSPTSGRAGVGHSSIPIENLNPGDWVIAHDGQPHRVLRTIRKHHRGQMVGIRHNLNPQTLWVTDDHQVLCQKRTLSYGAQRTWKHVPREHFPRSRELRKDMTAAEHMLWQALRGEQLGVKFRRQHPIGPYIVDFYSWEASLVVEVDGDSHFTPEGQEYDAARTEYLEALGLNVMRFTNDDVLHHREAVLECILEATQEATPSEDHYCQWRRAATLKVGDIVFTLPVDGEGWGGVSLPDVGEGRGEGNLQPVEITSIERVETEEEVYDLEIEGTHSFLTEVCAIHNCGSGTTLAVAEKLGRRWIGADLSRFAIQVTRKRLLDIPDCKPFEILNLGKYERQYWQVHVSGQGAKEDEALTRYLDFIVQLYRAEPARGFIHLHGKKAGRMVHVGAVDAPVTLSEINEALDECAANRFRGLDVLGWEWEMGLHDLVTVEARKRGVDLRLLTIPREVMDPRAVQAGDVHFYELAYLDVALERRGSEVQVVLRNFIIPNGELVPQEVREKIKRWSDYVDFWAVDWDYQGDTFHNQWQSYRTRKHPALRLESDWHKYLQPGKYQIMVKVIDIFGNDTSKLVGVTMP